MAKGLHLPHLVSLICKNENKTLPTKDGNGGKCDNPSTNVKELPDNRLPGQSAPSMRHHPQGTETGVSCSAEPSSRCLGSSPDHLQRWQVAERSLRSSQSCALEQHQGANGGPALARTAEGARQVHCYLGNNNQSRKHVFFTKITVRVREPWYSRLQRTWFQTVRILLQEFCAGPRNGTVSTLPERGHGVTWCPQAYRGTDT